jgi:hypothetical protein
LVENGGYHGWFAFDKQWYYYITVYYLLIAVNSAVNPIFYFWRMPALRRNVISKVRGVISRNNSVVKRPPNHGNFEKKNCTYKLVPKNKAGPKKRGAGEIKT